MKHLKKFNEEIGNPKEIKYLDFYQKYKNIVDYDYDEDEEDNLPSRIDLLSEIGDLCNELDMSQSDIKWVLDNYDCTFDYDRLLKIIHDETISNEPSSVMKKFVLVTKSESCDDYIYFIEHTSKPTNEEIKKFLVEKGSDYEDDYTYENVVFCKEIKDFQKI